MLTVYHKQQQLFFLPYLLNMDIFFDLQKIYRSWHLLTEHSNSVVSERTSTERVIKTSHFVSADSEVTLNLCNKFV